MCWLLFNYLFVKSELLYVFCTHWWWPWGSWSCRCWNTPEPHQWRTLWSELCVSSSLAVITENTGGKVNQRCINWRLELRVSWKVERANKQQALECVENRMRPRDVWSAPLRTTYHADLSGHQVAQSVEPVDVRLQITGLTLPEETLWTKREMAWLKSSKKKILSVVLSKVFISFSYY